MSTSAILSIIFAVLMLVAGFIASYYEANGKLNKVVVKYINQAEALYTDLKSGGTKMQWVCGQLYLLIPTAIRPFIPQSVVQIIVQTAFNEIDSYAKKQIDQAVDKVIPEVTSETVNK